jgi:hypothetical protein
MKARSVFISHASKDTALASQIKNFLERGDVSCWMAPGDIPPGSSYGEEIARAIEGCAALVLVLTEAANVSRAVANEVELAFRNQKVVIPIRLRPIQPSKSLKFFVSNVQWVDAFHTPLSTRVAVIVEIVRATERGEPALVVPETITVPARLERYLEGALRHKMLTAVSSLAILGFLTAAAFWNTVEVRDGMAEQKRAVSDDPAVFGLMTLSPGDGLDDLRVSVYGNLSDPTQAELRVAVFGIVDGRRIQVEIPPRELTPVGRDARVVNFRPPNATSRLALCMSAIHPDYKVTYVARWIYDLKVTPNGLSPVKVGSPAFTVGQLDDCSRSIDERTVLESG